MITPELLGAKPIYERVEGAPVQPRQRVRVLDGAGDLSSYGLSPYYGHWGVVEYLEYLCGCGQTYQTDPMIGVVFEDGRREEFWAEELEVVA